MTEAILDLRPARNTSTTLSTEQKRAIKFFVTAHMSAHEIASRLGLLVCDVREYCKSVFINVK